MRTLIEVDPADGPAELQSKYHAGSCAKPGGQIRVHSQGKGFRGFGICFRFLEYSTTMRVVWLKGDDRRR